MGRRFRLLAALATGCCRSAAHRVATQHAAIRRNTSPAALQTASPDVDAAAAHVFDALRGAAIAAARHGTDDSRRVAGSLAHSGERTLRQFGAAHDRKAGRAPRSLADAG